MKKETHIVRRYTSLMNSNSSNVKTISVMSAVLGQLNPPKLVNSTLVSNNVKSIWKSQLSSWPDNSISSVQSVLDLIEVPTIIVKVTFKIKNKL